MQEYIPNQHQPFEVPVLFLLINILLAVLIGGYAAGELHGTGLNKLVRCQRRSDWWICKCIWNVISVLGYYAALNEKSNGKDTMTGHWEMMGIETKKPFITFTEHGFPPELIAELEKKIGRASCRERV